MLTICAIIAVHNGEKTIGPVLDHLERNGINVYTIDHGSTDLTPTIIQGKMGCPISNLRSIAFDGIHRWQDMLRMKEQAVLELEHDWIIHADADEIMESPRHGESLRAMIERLDREGFDIIDCDEFVFVPNEEGEPKDFVAEMELYYHFSPVGRTLHRAQRRRGASLDWSSTGGHRLSSDGRLIATEKIRLRHYIGLSFDHLKSQYLGRVFSGSALLQGWHNNRVPTTPGFIVKPDRSRLINLREVGWRTDLPEQKHLLFHQPTPYKAPPMLKAFSEHEPFPFIVGVGRSGTTLLRLMVDAHPDIAVTPETHWLGAALSDLKLNPDNPQRAADRIRSEPSWSDMRIPSDGLDDIFAQYNRHAPFETIREIYAAYGRMHGKGRVGDKTPLHGLALHQIASALPEAHFIHLIRDGRDVATSFRDLWFGPGSDARDAAVFWMWRLREIRQQAQFVPNYMEVRYEELVTHPERILRRIGDFIKLPFHEAQLKFHERAWERLQELQDATRNGRLIRADQRRAIHDLTSQEPDPARIGRWRVAMSRTQLAEFERVAGDMLTDLGYERAIA